MTVVTDYQGLVDGLRAGRQETTGPCRKHADIWRLIWDTVEDFGRDCITLQKVESHVSLAKVRDGSAGLSFQDWAGNKKADEAAKKGAGMHPINAPLVERTESQRQLTREIGTWIGQVGAFLVSHGNPDVSTAGAEKPIACQLELTSVPMDFAAVGRSWKPRLYAHERRSAGKSARVVTLASGSAADTAKQLWHGSHSLYAVGDFIFCWDCGGRTSGKRLSKLLASSCKGRCGSVAGATALREGRHPTSGAFPGQPRACLSGQ